MAAEKIVEAKHPDVLRIHIAEIENSISHLNSSNDEIQSYLRETPDDKDLIGVIDENNEIIHRKQKQLEELMKILLAEALSTHAASSSSAPSSEKKTSSESDMIDDEEVLHDDGLYL